MPSLHHLETLFRHTSAFGISKSPEAARRAAIGSMARLEGPVVLNTGAVTAFADVAHANRRDGDSICGAMT